MCGRLHELTQLDCYQLIIHLTQVKEYWRVGTKSSWQTLEMMTTYYLLQTWLPQVLIFFLTQHLDLIQHRSPLHD